MKSAGGKVTDIEKFAPSSDAIAARCTPWPQPNPDAVLIAQGGPLLREIASALAAAGVNTRCQNAGHRLVGRPAIAREPMLAGGFFAAPAPEIDKDFDAKYRDLFRHEPAAARNVWPMTQYRSSRCWRTGTLSTLHGGGAHRPQRIFGVDGIFRFRADGTSERGLAVMAYPAGRRLHCHQSGPQNIRNTRRGAEPPVRILNRSGCQGGNHPVEQQTAARCR